MRNWAPRLGIVLCAVPVITVVGVSAADAPDGGSGPDGASTASVEVDASAPPNAAPPNPNAVITNAADSNSGGTGADRGEARQRRQAPGGSGNAKEAAKNSQGFEGKRQGAGVGADRSDRAGGERPAAGDRSQPGSGGGERQPRRAAAPKPNDTWQDAPAPDPESCPTVPRAVVVDRTWQRAWFCDDGKIDAVIPVTTARDQPDPGDYPIYAKDWQSFSDTTPQRSWLDRFIAFTRGENEGLRIGFHAVPYYEDGTRIQPFESVGSQRRFGDSDGCIRVLPEHAELLWAYLQEDDVVRVLT